MTAVKRLQAEWKKLQKQQLDGISVTPSDENFLSWDATIVGPPKTFYEGGVFVAKMEFPETYPYNPPKVTFKTKIFHPNIYSETGVVCISILHPPGKDPFGYESADERWKPTNSVEKVLVSVMNIMSEPNVDSAANIDAANLLRNNKEEFIRRAKADAKKSADIAERDKLRREQEKAEEEALLMDQKKKMEKDKISELKTGIKRSVGMRDDMGGSSGMRSDMGGSSGMRGDMEGPSAIRGRYSGGMRGGDMGTRTSDMDGPRGNGGGDMGRPQDNRGGDMGGMSRIMSGPGDMGPPSGIRAGHDPTSPMGMQGMGGRDNDQMGLRSSSRPSDTIIVRNLPMDVDWQGLEERFSHAGEVKYSEMQEGGVGLVRFSNERDAERAVSMMDGQCVDGTNIHVTLY